MEFKFQSEGKLKNDDDIQSISLEGGKKIRQIKKSAT